MLNKMINFANRLDKNRCLKEASIIDSIIKKIATDEDSDLFIEKESPEEKEDSMTSYRNILRRYVDEVINSERYDEVMGEIGGGFGADYVAMEFAEENLFEYGEKLVSELIDKGLIDIETAQRFIFIGDEPDDFLAGVVGAYAIVKEAVNIVKYKSEKVLFEAAKSHYVKLMKEHQGPFWNFEEKNLESFIKKSPLPEV